MNRFFKCLAVAVIFMFLVSIVAIKPKADTQYFTYNSWYTFDLTGFPLNDTSVGFINGVTQYVFTMTGEENVELSSNFINYITWDSDVDTLYYSIKFLDPYFNVYESYDIAVYENGHWLNDQYRYIFVDNADTTIGEFLENYGRFTYLFTPPSSSMKDLLYTYVDILPRTLESLTSFEILGVTLFTILGTIFLIYIVIKVLRR